MKRVINILFILKKNIRDTQGFQRRTKDMMTVNDLIARLEELKNNGRGEDKVIVDAGQDKLLHIDDVCEMFGEEVCIQVIEDVS